MLLMLSSAEARRERSGCLDGLLVTLTLCSCARCVICEKGMVEMGVKCGWGEWLGHGDEKGKGEKKSSCYEQCVG